jgi:septum formation protein
MASTAPIPPPVELVLASTSAYRRALLQRLELPFTVRAPGVDETPLPAETPAATALRLAAAKARAVAPACPAGALIVGSDQVAELDGTALGKPGTHDAARRQLRALSGRAVVFHTALCLLDTRSGLAHSDNVDTVVRFRHLLDGQIERYLRRDRPYDCAGSARIEGLGIALVESAASADPTALIGLPLIALTGMLQRAGIDVIAAA